MGRNMTAEPEAQASDIKKTVREGLLRSLASLIVKVGAAGLTYAMFVVMARALDVTQYGFYAFGVSLATMVAIGASMGQQTAILRYWPEEEGKSNRHGAMSALQSGWALTLIAGVVFTLVIAIVAIVYGIMGAGFEAGWHMLAASTLILPLAAAEYGSAALRAQGSVWSAMAPRDILWRGGVLVFGVVLIFLGLKISGAVALLVTAVLLALALVLQVYASHRRGYVNSVSLKGLPGYVRRHGKASLWYLTGTVIDSAALNLDIVLVGLFIAAESAGLYFNAFRTAGLLTLFMYAITLVIAPMVARAYHGGELRKAQAVTTFCAWAGFLFSLAVFVGFCIFGELILSLFGPEYAAGHLVLIVLSVGLLADAATGPTRIVMMMTGHERDYVRIFGAIMVVGLLAQLIIIPLFGVLAAAIVNTLARIVAQTAIAVWTRKHVGIDTSLLGIFDLMQKKA